VQTHRNCGRLEVVLNNTGYITSTAIRISQPHSRWKESFVRCPASRSSWEALRPNSSNATGRGRPLPCCRSEFRRGGLLQGAFDLVKSYEASAIAKGDSVTILKLKGAGHFDMLAPESQFGQPVVEAILALLT